MKILVMIFLIFKSFDIFSSTYECIDIEAARSILTVNLAKEFGYHQTTVSSFEDIDSLIHYYKKSLIPISGGYMTLPNSYYREVIFISCLGVYKYSFN